MVRSVAVQTYMQPELKWILGGCGSVGFVIYHKPILVRRWTHRVREFRPCWCGFHLTSGLTFGDDDYVKMPPWSALDFSGPLSHHVEFQPQSNPS